MRRAAAEKLQQIATHITQALQEFILPPLQKEMEKVIGDPISEWEIAVPPNTIEIYEKRRLKTALWVPYPSIYLYEVSATARVTFRLAAGENRHLATLWKVIGEVAMIPSQKKAYPAQEVGSEDEEGEMQSGCVIYLKAEGVWVEGSPLMTTSTTSLIKRVVSDQELRDSGLPSAVQIRVSVNSTDVENIAQYLAIHFLPIRHWTESCGHLLTRFLLDALQTPPSFTLTDDIPHYEPPHYAASFISYTVELNCVRAESKPSFIVQPLAYDTIEGVGSTLEVKFNTLWEMKVTPERKIPPFTLKFEAEVGLTLTIEENPFTKERTASATLTFLPQDASPKPLFTFIDFAQTTLVEKTHVESVADIERVVRSIGSRLGKDAFEMLEKSLEPVLLRVTRRLLTGILEGRRKIGGEEGSEQGV